MVSQINIIAINYAMNILLLKRKLENNQPLPLAINLKSTEPTIIH
jgi:hypothetical protein